MGSTVAPEVVRGGRSGREPPPHGSAGFIAIFGLSYPVWEPVGGSPPPGAAIEAANRDLRRVSLREPNPTIGGAKTCKTLCGVLCLVWGIPYPLCEAYTGVYVEVCKCTP